MKPVHTVGILGLGKMGCPIAAHLVAKGFKVVGYDPLEEARNKPSRWARARQPLRAKQRGRATSSSSSSVSTAKSKRFSSAGRACSRAQGRALSSRWVPRWRAILDAARCTPRGERPRSPRHPARSWEAAATAGKLLVYGAGDPDAFELCRPVFGAFASDVFHLGPAGAGQVAKMVNNLILWACIAVNDEALRLGAALGVDPKRLCEALRHGSAQNWAMDTQAERSGMPWAEKDMSIVLEEADRARLSLPLAGTVKEAIKGLKIRMGLGMPEIPEPL